MSGSKSKGKARTGAGTAGSRGMPKRGAAAAAAAAVAAASGPRSLSTSASASSTTATAAAAASASAAAATLNTTVDGDSLDSLSGTNPDATSLPSISSTTSSSSTLISTDPLPDCPAGIEEFGSLLPGKSDAELTYTDLINSLNHSISTSAPANAKYTISEAIPSKRDLVSLRYDLARLLRLSVSRLAEYDQSMNKLKRLSSSVDRECEKKRAKIEKEEEKKQEERERERERLKEKQKEDEEEEEKEEVKKEAANTKTSTASFTPQVKIEDQSDNTTTTTTTATTTTDDTTIPPKIEDLVTIKTETKLPTDTTGLHEPEAPKSLPEYEKNPKSEFVTSQELPISALNLFEEQVKGLPTNGEEYLLKKYAVASYPRDNLKDWLPGEIPDHDFTKAKPPTQVQFSTFSSYIEPYFRPFTEEDVTFLKQKLIGGPYGYAFLNGGSGSATGANGSNGLGNGSGSGGSGAHGSHGAAAALAAASSAAAARRAQLSPYVVPKLGRLYAEVWREQDGKNAGYVLHPPVAASTREVQANGGSGGLTDWVLEREDVVSCGPLASRLLSALMSEDCENNKKETVKKEEEDTAVASESGVVVKQDDDDEEEMIVNGGRRRGDARIKREDEDEDEDEDNGENGGDNDDEETNMKDETRGKSETLAGTGWTIGAVAADFSSLEERLKREFKYVGILDMQMLRREEQRKKQFEMLTAGTLDANSGGETGSGGGVGSSGGKDKGGIVGLTTGTTVGATSPTSVGTTVSAGSSLDKKDEFEIDWVSGREDDEISTELRFLQKQLRAVSQFNRACQRVLLPVVEEQLAWQEYTQILDDLDKQVDQAYLRRNRTTTRVKKKKSSAAAAAAAAASAGSGASGEGAGSGVTGASADQAHRLRNLLDKRQRWISSIGPVFRDSRSMKGMPREPVFAPEKMEALMQEEEEGEDI